MHWQTTSTHDVAPTEPRILLHNLMILSQSASPTPPVAETTRETARKRTLTFITWETITHWRQSRNSSSSPSNVTKSRVWKEDCSDITLACYKLRCFCFSLMSSACSHMKTSHRYRKQYHYFKITLFFRINRSVKCRGIKGHARNLLMRKRRRGTIG